MRGHKLDLIGRIRHCRIFFTFLGKSVAIVLRKVELQILMKKFGALALTLSLVGMTFLALEGCKPKAAALSKIGPPGGITSAETTSFQEVTSKLDAGGNFYLYLSTEQWLKHLSDSVESFHSMATSLGNAPGDRQSVDNVFKVVTKLIKDSGMEEISGVGMSSIAREPGFYYNKLIVHHYAGQGDGFLWSMFGKTPHDLDGLNLLPANTALAAFYDVDEGQIWDVVQKQIEDSGFPEAQNFLKTFPQEFEKSAGMKWADVIHSLDGEVGFVVTLDEARTVKIPMGGQGSLEIPDPGMMLVFKVKNDAIFDRVDAVLKKQAAAGMISMDKDGVKMRTVPVPLPLPITLRPSIAVSGGYLIIATSDALIQEALAVKGGKAGLKSTDEFKKLSSDIPTQGNQFAYMSKSFGETLLKVQSQALSANGQLPPGLRSQLSKLMVQTNKVAFAYGVGASTDEGWMSVANGSQSSGNAVAMGAVAVPAMMAAVALPAFAKARTTAQVNSTQNVCLNNLRMIDAAKQQWALEKNKKDDAVPVWADIQPYVGRGRAAMRCPQGGEYTLGAVGVRPTCSIPGHVLP